MICLDCEHDQSRHAGGTGGCRKCDLGCKRFDGGPAEPVPVDTNDPVAYGERVAEAMAVDAAAKPSRPEFVDPTPTTVVEQITYPEGITPAQVLDDAEIEAADDREAARTGGTFALHYLGEHDATESTSAALARVTRERDEAAESAEVWERSARDRKAELAQLREDMQTQARIVVKKNEQLSTATAELETLRDETRRLRDQLGFADSRIANGPADGLGELLADAEASGDPALTRTAEDIRDRLADLQTGLAEHAKNAELRNELAQLEARAAAIREQLGKPAPEPKPDVDYRAIRTWAKANGFDVHPHGRVPGGVISAYRAAQQTT